MQTPIPAFALHESVLGYKVEGAKDRTHLDGWIMGFYIYDNQRGTVEARFVVSTETGIVDGPVEWWKMKYV